MITALAPFGVSRTPSGPYFASSRNPGGGGGGLPLPGDRDDIAVAYEDAYDETDASEGRIRNGFFFPDHAIREVDGVEYGYPFAPEPQRRLVRII